METEKEWEWMASDSRPQHERKHSGTKSQSLFLAWGHRLVLTAQAELIYWQCCSWHSYKPQRLNYDFLIPRSGETLPFLCGTGRQKRGKLIVVSLESTVDSRGSADEPPRLFQTFTLFYIIYRNKGKMHFVRHSNQSWEKCWRVVLKCRSQNQRHHLFVYYTW